MAIITKHNINISINEKSFSIIVQEQMTTIQKDEFEKSKDEFSEKFKDRDALQSKLSVKEEDFEINKHILAHGKVFNIVKVMFEQKSLNREIFDAREKIAKEDKKLNSLSKAMDWLLEKRYDLIVEGEGKESLKQEITSLNISYETLFNEIAKEVSKSLEKK